MIKEDNGQGSGVDWTGREEDICGYNETMIRCAKE
jgi:hypothetical protein